jgi:hypothetical protein
MAKPSGGSMARRAFYSFHYLPDGSRAGQVRNMGAVDGNPPATDNEWETIKRRGDQAISKWIDDQLYGKSVAIVLIGSNTANRKWINYEIETAWSQGKGVLGIHVHNLKDLDAKQSFKGTNPFNYVFHKNSRLSNIVGVYEPPYYDSKDVYAHIKANLASWIDSAIELRSRY